MDMQVGNGDLGPPVWLRGDFGCSFCLVGSQKKHHFLCGHRRAQLAPPRRERNEIAAGLVLKAQFPESQAGEAGRIWVFP